MAKFLRIFLFAFILLSLNNTVRAEFYEFPDYYNTPSQNVYVPAKPINPVIYHNDFDNHTEPPTPVHEIQTGAPNTTLTHPVNNPFASPTPTFTLRKN